YLQEVANNKMRGNENEVNNASNQSVEENIQKLLEEMFPSPTAGSAGPNFGRRRQSAGATTIAEGEAAQGIVGDMQMKHFLYAAAQQARNAMNPRFRYER